MPLKPYLSEGLVVESEHTHTTLRVFAGDRRCFVCQVTAAGITTARITNAVALGPFEPRTWRVIKNWLLDQGYTEATFERSDGRVKRLKAGKHV
ncbi:hypothetical protein [Bowmanella dokdonensis]|uniref:Uncharacterized protein n=1 Tax=Bowmanella dokdonensis TaxID=751969 RepID=A0A939ING3_9ALTE|nr:hypothetical protein [Bowmanella dokdonensis]MBN7824790.1 hypothetical protein [Bowmanella dokdonensis]